MEIKDFEVEQWMNLWETKCTHNVAETCVYSLSLDQLFELTGGDKQAFLDAFAARRLTYGDIEGRPDLLSGIAKLYRTVAPEHIIPTHGAAGANALVLSTLVNPGDHVVSVMPTYQQLYSIPEMCGAAVDVLHLEKENGLPRGRGGPGRPVHAGDEGHLHQQSRQSHGRPARRRDAAGHRGGGAQERRVAALRRGVPPLEPDRRVRRVGRRPLRQGRHHQLHEQGVVAGGHPSGLVRHQGRTAAPRPSVPSRLQPHLLRLVRRGRGRLRAGHADAILDRSRRIVRENLVTLLEWVESEPHLSVVPPEAGTTALVYYDYDIPSYDFCTDMVKFNGAFVTPGDCFEEPKSFRVGYGYSDDTAN